MNKIKEKRFYYILAGNEQFVEDKLKGRDLKTDNQHLLRIGFYSKIGTQIRKKLNSASQTKRC